MGTLPSTGPEDGWTRHYAWLRPVGGGGVVFADGNAGQLDWWAGGLALGYEGQARLGGGDARFGLGLGYLVNGASLLSRLSTLEGQGIHGGIYGGWSDGAMSLSGSLAYGAHHISTSRDVVIGALTETAKADYWAQSIGIDIEGSYGFALTNTVSIAPVGTLRAAWSGHNGVTETGAGALNATVDPAGFWQLDAGLGIELAYEASLGNGAVVTLSSALWEHAFGDVRPEQSLALAGGGGSFAVAGPAAGRDRLKLGASLAYQPDDDITLSLEYGGTLFGGQQSHTATAGITVAF